MWPFLQKIVLNYAYDDFIHKVAGYLKNASEESLQDFLLYEAYAIFQDRWPYNEYSKAWVRSISDVLHLDLTTLKVCQESCSGQYLCTSYCCRPKQSLDEHTRPEEGSPR